MNKSNYYYKKLGQSFIFNEQNWHDIIDPTEPHDNVFSPEFLNVFHELLFEYYQLECLDPCDRSKIFQFLNDLRFDYPFQTKSEKREITLKVNEMISLGNQIGDTNALSFYLSEYQKRYGSYVTSPTFQRLLAYYFAIFVDEDPIDIKTDLGQDIYPLILLFHPIESLTSEHEEYFLLAQCFLSAVSVMIEEAPTLLQDPIIKKRFLYFLERNRCLAPLSTSKEDNHDLLFRVQNKQLIKRLNCM